MVVDHVVNEEEPEEPIIDAVDDVKEEVEQQETADMIRDVKDTLLEVSSVERSMELLAAMEVQDVKIGEIRETIEDIYEMVSDVVAMFQSVVGAEEGDEVEDSAPIPVAPPAPSVDIISLKDGADMAKADAEDTKSEEQAAKPVRRGPRRSR